MFEFLRNLFLVAGMATMVGSSNVHCPLDNNVEKTCGLYDAETHSSYKLTDSLTVVSHGEQPVLLLNRAQNVSSFVLPLRQAVECDTLLLRFGNAKGQSATDTLFLEHDNTPHFESIDCPAAVFHQLKSVRWTSHSLNLMPLTLDSVAIVRKTVNYENVENLKLYLRSTSGL